MKKILITLFICIFSLNISNIYANSKIDQQENIDKLVIVWSSDDKEVANQLVLLYSYNAMKYKWFKEITIVIWGPSAKLVAKSKKMQKSIKKLQEIGVEIRACIVCANNYKVTDKLKDLGVDVQGMGKPLTKYLKTGHNVITF